MHRNIIEPHYCMSKTADIMCNRSCMGIQLTHFEKYLIIKFSCIIWIYIYTPSIASKIVLASHSPLQIIIWSVTYCMVSNCLTISGEPCVRLVMDFTWVLSSAGRFINNDFLIKNSYFLLVSPYAPDIWTQNTV